MGTPFYRLSIGILAVWRITHFLHTENGPWNSAARLRRVIARRWSDFMDCFYCLSFWVALPVARFIGEGLLDYGILWPALSAGAILLERITTRGEATPVFYTEDKENDDVLR